MAELNAGAPASATPLPADVEELLVNEGKPAAEEKADDPFKKLLDQLGEFTSKVDTRLSQVEAKFRETDGTTKDIAKTQKELLDLQHGAQQRGFARAMDDLDQIMDKAAAEADMETYAKAKRQKQELEKVRPQLPQPGQTAQPTNGAQPQQNALPQDVVSTITAWQGKNTWYESDPELTAFARAHDMYLSQTKPGVPLAKRLEMVAEKTQAEFPDKFGNARRQAPPAVANSASPGSKTNAGGKTKEKTFADIPEAERDHAKAAYEKLKVRIPGYTTKDYMAAYFKEDN